MTRQRIEFAPGCFRDVEDNVVPIASPAAEDAAWEQYAAKARELADNPLLLCDRAFNEELERRRARWAQLFAIAGGGER